MIIGVALVVDDIHKGQRLAFRYPESVPSSVINSNDQLLKFHEDYLSMSPDNFARLFRPKHAMLNKVMEIIIEDLQYISFPMPCSHEFLELSSSTAVHDDLSMFNVVIATVRENALRRIRNRPLTTENARRKPGEDPVAELLGLSNHTLPLTKEILHSVVEKFTRALLNQEKRMGYVSQEVNLIFRILEESDRFLSTPQSPSTSSSERRDRSSSFAISNEGYSMNSAANNSSTHNSTGPPTHTEGEVQANKKLTLCEFVLQQSSLANELRGGYCVSLTVNGVLSLNIPLIPQPQQEATATSQTQTLPISKDESRDSHLLDEISKKKSTQDQHPADPSTPIDQSPKFYRRNPQRLFPFHSFLAVADAEELSDIMNKLGCTFNTTLEAPPLPSYLPEKTIPISPSPAVLNSLKNRAMAAGCLVSPGAADLSESSFGTFSNSQPPCFSIVGLTGPVCSHQCSPLVHRILTNINPTISFAELRNSLDCSMEEIYAVVNHLSLWGLGEVICPLSDESLFQINPEFPLANETTADHLTRKIGQKAARAFSTTFSGTDINAILASFTGSVTLKEAIQKFPKKLQSYGVDIVIWLMRRHIIRELQFYFIDLSLCPSLSSLGSVNNSPHTPQSQQQQQQFSRLDNNNLNKLRQAYQNPATASAVSGSLPTSAYSSYSGNNKGASSMDQQNNTFSPLFEIKKRLEKYFDGRTPLCEILWLEDDHQITIEKLFLIVKKFHIVINIRP